MNFKKIIQFNNLRSQLTEQELTLADAFHNATDAERELIVESLAPEQPKKPERSQQARCTHVYASGLVCNGAARNIVHHNANHLDFHQFTTEKQKKSKHAQSIGGAIQRTPKSKVDDEDERCTALRDDDRICGLLSDHNVHQMTSARGYHPFVSAADAVDAEGRSSANGEAAASTVSSEEQTENVAVAAGGSNE